MSKNVYVVHCVDTEGPLYESLSATFSRLKEIFGIDLDPTKENLKKIQNKELDLGGREDLIADAFAPKRIANMGTWDKIDTVLDDLMSDKFRLKYPDSDGNGWVFNWFCLDHCGFTGNNPRHRDAGFGNVYIHYLEKLRENGSLEKDLLQFHYHPLPFNGHFNYAGTAYVNSSNLFDILAHRLIDNEMFPAAYRAGMEAERPDAHWFLEQWIPFDYSNDSFIKDNADRQPDLRDGRYGDWRRASMEWKPYHPSHDNYQLKGSCHRWITRCISLDSRVAKLEAEDVREAFEQANHGQDAIISFANHDFRDMHDEVETAMKMISSVANSFRDVKFHYCNAIDAMVLEENLSGETPGFSVRVVVDDKHDSAELFINAVNPIFGTQPFFAIKTIVGQYYWDNLDYGTDGKSWSYVFDDKTINVSALDTVAFASNTENGITEITKIDFKDRITEQIIKKGHIEIKRMNLSDTIR